MRGSPLPTSCSLGRGDVPAKGAPVKPAEVRERGAGGGEEPPPAPLPRPCPVFDPLGAASSAPLEVEIGVFLLRSPGLLGSCVGLLHKNPVSCREIDSLHALSKFPPVLFSRLSRGFLSKPLQKQQQQNTPSPPSPPQKKPALERNKPLFSVSLFFYQHLVNSARR